MRSSAEVSSSRTTRQVLTIDMYKVTKIYFEVFSETVILVFIIQLWITDTFINSFRERKKNVCGIEVSDMENSISLWSCLQRAPGQLSKNFKHQLSPSGELVPPVRDGVELLRVGQQHLLGSVPQRLRVERVPQNESAGKEVQSNDIA